MPDVYTLASAVSLPGRARGGKWTDDLGASGVAKHEIPKVSPPHAGWTWTHDPSEPSTVKDVWYQDGVTKSGAFVPGHRMKVFDHVRWGPVGVVGSWDDPATPDSLAWKLTEKYPGDQELRGLPLTAEYMVGRFALTGGSVETDALWPLDWGVDTALVLLFAYELRFASDTGRRTGACEVKPVAAADYKHKSFMEAFGVEGITAKGGESYRRVVSGALSGAGTEKVTELQLTSPRVLVALTFTGCEPRADVEPGAIVTMARAMPHVLVLSSVPMHQTLASTEVKRPSRSSMYAPPASDSVESHGEKIKSILFTDTNDTRGIQWASRGLLPPVPYWYNMFDHYRIMGDSDPSNIAKGQGFSVVRRTKGARTISGAAAWQGSYFGEGEDGSVPIDVNKVARQGAYDNLHMSPRMVAPESLMAKYPHLRVHLADIVQAPFCDCDCLHVHWRWGVHATARHVKGWGTSGPHTVAGAPMVPPNQTVKLFTDSDSQFTYLGYARPTKAGQWQVFFHHGTALALRIGETWGAWGQKVMAGTSVNLVDATDENLEMPWSVNDAAGQFMSVFYYRLRFHTNQGGAKAVERLVVLDRGRLEGE